MLILVCGKRIFLHCGITKFTEVKDLSTSSTARHKYGAHDDS